jgi:hypothetical protein
MKKFILTIVSTAFFLSLFSGCGKEKERPMVDMDSIKTDGSYDDKHIFKKEIEKEVYRSKKYKKDQF